MNFNLKKTALFIVPATLMLGGCTDFNNEFEAKQYEYNKEFSDLFGEIDPNQDWSMAATLKANVSVGSNPSVMIYSDKPGRAGSKPLGLINGNSGIFNAIKGTNQVYAVVSENGKQLVAGYYDVESNSVTISSTPVAKRKVATRSGEEEETSSTSITKTHLFTHQTYDPEFAWDGITYQFNPNGTQDGFVQAKLESVDGADQYFIYWSSSITGPFKKLAHNATYGAENTLFGYQNGTLKFADGDEGDAITISYLPNYVKKGSSGELAFWGPEAKTKQRYDGKYYSIVGETKTTDSEWLIGACHELFWDGDACFLESEDFRSARKQAVYAKYGATVADLQKGVEFTTVEENQNINIPMMYGATTKNNIFGYYYYRKTAFGENPAQDPRSVNRYILFDDASPTTNIKVGGNTIGGMTLQSRLSGWEDNTVVTCTTRRLVWFGEDGNNTNGSFDFPEGVTIGFFIMQQNNDYSVLTGCTQQASWAYSSPSLNKSYMYDANGLSDTRKQFWGYRYGVDSSIPQDYGTVGVDGRVKAITWSYGNKILVGFGDDSGDEDLNDFVFWYDGEVSDDEKPKIKITDNTTTRKSWVFACEDLGGTYDYDFNDIVWEVSQEYTTVETKVDGTVTGTTTTYKDAEINLLASGGILPVEIIYDGTSLGETHELFGQSSGSKYNQVNVGSGISANIKKIGTIPATAEIDINDLKSKFKVRVSNTDGTTNYITACTDGASATAPQVIILPGGWDWPTEGTRIDAVYGDFTEWVENTKNTDWYTKKNGKQATSCITNPSKPTGSQSSSSEEVIPGGGGSGSGGDSGSGDTPSALPAAEFTVTINGTTVTSNGITINVGDVISPTITITEPQGSDNNNINVTSGDETVLHFSQNSHNGYNCTMTALKAGTSTVTITRDATTTHRKTEFSFEVTVVDSSSGGGSGEGGGSSTKLTLNATTGNTVKIGDLGYADWNGYEVLFPEGTNANDIPDGTYTMSFTGTSTGACIRTATEELVATAGGNPITFSQDVLKKLINKTAYLANAYGNTDFSSTTMTITQQ